MILTENRINNSFNEKNNIPVVSNKFSCPQTDVKHTMSKNEIFDKRMSSLQEPMPVVKMSYVSNTWPTNDSNLANLESLTPEKIRSPSQISPSKYRNSKIPEIIEDEHDSTSTNEIKKCNYDPNTSVVKTENLVYDSPNIRPYMYSFFLKKIG